MDIITSTHRSTDRNRRARVVLAAAGAAAAITALAGSASGGASAGAPVPTNHAADPTGLGAALAVTYDVLPHVLPPGIDDASQLGYPEAECAADLCTWILGS